MTTLIKTANEEALQELLREAHEGIERIEPTHEDINRMAAIEEERFTEGRIRRPRIPSPHWD